MKSRYRQCRDENNRKITEIHWDVGWIRPDAYGFMNENSHYTEYKWESIKIFKKVEDAALLCNYLNGGANSESLQTKISELLQDIVKTIKDDDNE